MKKKNANLFLEFFRLIYIKLFKIDDTPQKVATGFGLGAFLGILPGTGPIAAFVVASFLRINRAAAILGSLLTNTWLSILTIFLSIRIGAAIMHLSYKAVYRDWQLFLKYFRWLDLFKLSVLKIIIPVVLGYLVIGFCLGLLLYFTVLIILTRRKYEDKSRTRLSS